MGQKSYEISPQQIIICQYWFLFLSYNLFFYSLAIMKVTQKNQGKGQKIDTKDPVGAKNEKKNTDKLKKLQNQTNEKKEYRKKHCVSLDNDGPTYSYPLANGGKQNFEINIRPPIFDSLLMENNQNESERDDSSYLEISQNISVSDSKTKPNNQKLLDYRLKTVLNYVVILKGQLRDLSKEFLQLKNENQKNNEYNAFILRKYQKLLEKQAENKNMLYQEYEQLKFKYKKLQNQTQVQSRKESLPKNNIFLNNKQQITEKKMRKFSQNISLSPNINLTHHQIGQHGIPISEYTPSVKNSSKSHHQNHEFSSINSHNNSQEGENQEKNSRKRGLRTQNEEFRSIEEDKSQKMGKNFEQNLEMVKNRIKKLKQEMTVGIKIGKK